MRPLFQNSHIAQDAPQHQQHCHMEKAAWVAFANKAGAR